MFIDIRTASDEVFDGIDVPFPASGKYILKKIIGNN